MVHVLETGLEYMDIDNPNGKPAVRGYNIINGQLECNIKCDSRVEDRVLYYERYAKIFGVSPGDNLYCDKQKPFSWG